MKKSLFVPMLLVFFYGCAIKPLAYFTTEPYAKPFDEKVNKTLYIVLKEDVLDSFTVMGDGIKPMTVTQYRKSLEYSLDKTFRKNFSNVVFTDKKADSSITLVFYRVKAYWKIASTSTSYNYSSHTSHTTAFISTINQYESSLYYRGTKISAADGESASEGSASSVGLMPHIFTEGTRVMCEQLNRTMFTDAALQKLK